jgi:CheY-like chemotaxis protein
MLAEVLRLSGFSPIVTGDPAEALQMAEKSPPAVIVADLHLPGSMNGLEFTHRLKRGATTKHVPVIMLTGMARVHDRNLASSAGVDAFLVKPCAPVELVREIHRLIAAARMGRV